MCDGIRYLAHSLHQPSDPIQHVVDRLGELVEFIAAAGQPDALGEIATRDRRGRRRHIRQRPAEQAPHHQRADGGHHHNHQQGPQQRIGQQMPQLRAHLGVASHQQAITVR